VAAFVEAVLVQLLLLCSFFEGVVVAPPLLLNYFYSRVSMGFLVARLVWVASLELNCVPQPAAL
jgi:hypothetical protein